MSEAYLFDSYAIIEVLRGNQNYSKYSKANIITTQLTLFEVYYTLIREGKAHAQEFIRKYEKYAVPYNSNTICIAAALKLAHKERKLSMSDCIGYSLALEYGIKFLTGDQEFKDMKNVEYVK